MEPPEYAKSVGVRVRKCSRWAEPGAGLVFLHCRKQLKSAIQV